MTSTRTEHPEAVGVPPLTVDDLRARISGTVVTPSDADYDDARHIFFRHLERRPGAVVRVADAADVGAAIDFARTSGLEVAIRSGGHSGAAFGTVDDGVVIDVRGLDSIDVDAEARTAWVGAGVTAGELTQALGAHGLAAGFGDTGSVGVAGITLGGGQGFLSRKHGLTVDNLLAVELVTADGRVLHVDAGHHPDLFWAVRGGGGGFGVATRFQYRLHELPQIVGGMVLLPATPDTIARFVELALAAPDETSWTAYADSFGLAEAELVVDTLTARLADPDVLMAVVQLRPQGGAIGRVASDATAYAHRERAIMLNTAAIVSGVDALEAQQPWLRDLATSLSAGAPGAYVGFVVDPSHNRIHEIDPGATYTRLAEVKREWDPDDVFHHNHTVPPAG